ncbi:hypothetical protein K435DRAFT_701826 [Dendrothele bispora CBS 962.96]|uniref:Uncharacterized protein n=1 Tax=Dendrothele bispora (strain CBS 962.96) TaxID=1314807 RepID=A0A4S8KQ59_DENBC|nr:hypothetical protein K435DRAFT_701826 [Dendrothele bispora CBS 962.96]
MNYSPYPNKLMMLLDIMDNLPRLRLSTAHFHLIIWLLKEAGVQNVPKYDSFREMQKNLTKVCGSEPIACTSSVGNHFYVNDPREAIKRQFANPEVAPHINFYPEETDGPISEVWQAERWKEFDANDLTPMYSSNGKQFYINEVAMLNDDRLVIPLLWVKRKGILHADCNIVEVMAVNFTINIVQYIPASEFLFNYFDIIESITDKIPWQNPSSVPAMPNPKRDLVGKDEDLYVVMIPIWADDVSGNKSKQYNKHINLYMENSNLPARLLQQEYFVNFLSTSPNASSPEQFSEIRNIVNETQTNPIRCFNADTQRTCRVILRVPSLPADNPQQSEEASHIGGNGNKYCRRCDAGGSYQVTGSEDGYHALFSTGAIRSAVETRETLERQLRAAMTGVHARVKEIQTETGTKDKVTDYWIDILMQRANETLANDPRKSRDDLVNELTEWLDSQPGDKMNPLLDIAGLDPTQDTPVEILHTILLGIVKYVWLMFHSKLSDDQQKLFATRLQETDTDGLTIPPLRAAYMIQYRNGLIGKHFKALMQTMVFHVHDLVTPTEFEVIKAVGELGSMLWVSEISDMNQFLSDLEIRIGNVLDAFAAVDAHKIVCKIKLHLLSHLISDIRRYGPAIHNSTEIFECFNAVFRMCSILSNHQAPSRDIATKFASMDRIKHILSGGYWLYKGEWIQASPLVRRMLRNDPVIQQHLGWAPPPKIAYGTFRINNTVSNQWKDTAASSVYPAEVKLKFWHDNQSVVAQSGDVCKKYSWVAVGKSNSDSFAIGRLVELLAPEDNIEEDPEYILTVENFILGNTRHPDFDMPVLHRPTIEDRSPKYLTIDPGDILFRLSVQHDCRLHNCQTTGSRTVMQEHRETPRHISKLEHSEDNHFIINTHALHNSTLLRNLLPRPLTEPKPLHEDRRIYHFSVATEYRVTQDAKRKATAAKTKATKAANKKAKKDREAEIEVHIGEDSSNGAQRPVPKRKRRRVETDEELGEDDNPDL